MLSWVTVKDVNTTTKLMKQLNLKAKRLLKKGLILSFAAVKVLNSVRPVSQWIAIQIKKAFAGISADDAKKVVVAYEPIWAIGTGKTATDDQAEEVCGGIRELLENLYDAETAKAITIQYGGSIVLRIVQDFLLSQTLTVVLSAVHL